MTVRLAGPAFLLSCAVLLAGCGGSSETPARGSRPVPTIALPSRMVGLAVKNEDIRSSLAQGAEQPFVDSVGLFSFREPDDLLQATLQVSRFTEDARPEEGEFRGAIVSRIGGTTPRQVRVGRQAVFVTSGRNQNVFIWFQRDGFFVITVRSDYEFPRTLLRRILELNITL